MTPAPLDEDVLRRLAAPGDRPAAPTRSLGDVRRRAGRLRLRRHGAAGMAAGATALAAVALTSVSLPYGGSSRVVVGSSGTDLAPGCTTGYADQITYAAARDLLYLPAADVAGAVTGKVFVRSMRSDCAYPRLAATAARVTDGAVDASLSVYGPDAAPLPPPGAELGPDVIDRTFPAGARVVRLVVFTGTRPQRAVEAAWTEPDGTTWQVSTKGLDDDQVLAAVAALRIEGGRLDLDSLPADLPERRGYGADEQRQRTTRSVRVPFGGTDEQSTKRWTLTVSDAGSTELALQRLEAGVREVTVPGAGAALWVASGKAGALVWRPSDGPMFIIEGETMTLEKASRIAETVAPTGLDDARLLAAQEGPIPTDTGPSTVTTSPDPTNS